MATRTTLTVETGGRGLYELSDRINAALDEAGITSGSCHCFIRHTSASLLITENADPQVHRDLEAFLARLVPDGDALFRHTAEGPDDMPAHVRNVLTATELTIPVEDGRLALGTWQGVYVYEHRHAPHRRSVMLTLTGW